MLMANAPVDHTLFRRWETDNRAASIDRSVPASLDVVVACLQNNLSPTIADQLQVLILHYAILYDRSLRHPVRPSCMASLTIPPVNRSALKT